MSGSILYWFTQSDGSVCAEAAPSRDVLHDDPLGSEILLAVDGFLQELASVELLPQALWREFRPSPFNDVIEAAREAERRAGMLRGAR
jgi:hypothetical protein